MTAIISILLLIHVFFGRLVVVFLPMYWAYNVAQRGDSFGYALLTYFGNVIILGFAWVAIHWVLNTLLKGAYF